MLLHRFVLLDRARCESRETNYVAFFKLTESRVRNTFYFRPWIMRRFLFLSPARTTHFPHFIVITVICPPNTATLQKLNPNLEGIKLTPHRKLLMYLKNKRFNRVKAYGVQRNAVKALECLCSWHPLESDFPADSFYKTMTRRGCYRSAGRQTIPSHSIMRLQKKTAFYGPGSPSSSFLFCPLIHQQVLD